LNATVERKRREPTPGDETLAAQIRSLPPREAAALVERALPAEAVEALLGMNPAIVQAILRELEPGPRRFLAASAPPDVAEQWKRNMRYPDGTIGRMMEAPVAVFQPGMSVGEATERLRPIVGEVLVTYVFVVDADGRLVGLVTMRDLLFGAHEALLSDVMLRDPFALSPELAIAEAMKLTVNRHYPEYPVVDGERRLIGLVRGAALFEMEAFEITAQPGAMVGVEKEERIATPLAQAFKFRNPWLLVNLVTAFAAGGVVAVFQGTVDRLVILATFLPVVIGQCGNTGCQALAVMVRGLTLGEVKPGGARGLVSKEALLGVANGAVTGVLCAIAMALLAWFEHSGHELMLGLVVFVAMVVGCAVSGVSGALVPLLLRRFGADPATASSIIVTTVTDIASMGLLLALAAALVR
jgi:magnesium transporter